MATREVERFYAIGATGQRYLVIGIEGSCPAGC
jgi:hypothetical protein